MKAIIYARVSDDSQRSNYSIPTQVSACVEYVHQQGHQLVGDRFVDRQTGYDTLGGEGSIRAFVDDYTSTEEERPSLNAALEYLQQNDVDEFVVLCLDRLARDPYIRHALEVAINEYGTRVHYVQGDYDDTPEGEVKKDLDAVFAKWENAKRVERAGRGKKESARRGHYVGGRRPYGYIVEDGFLVIYEPEAKVVRLIFKMYLDGNSLHAIKDFLNQQGYPTAQGASWHRSTLRKILTNTIYVGFGYYNRRYKAKKKVKIRAEEEWIKYETPQIVSRNDFDAVAKKLEENRRFKRRQPKHKYLLSGMIRCIDCGQTYTGQATNSHGGKRLIYRHRHACRNHSKACSKIDLYVWGKIRELLLHPENLREGYEEVYREWEEKTHVRRRQLAEFETKLASMYAQQERLTELHLNPEVGLTEAEYIKQRARIQDEIDQLSSLIADRNKALEPMPPPDTLADMESFSEEIRDILDGEVPFELKRKILQELNVMVYINPEEIHIKGWFGVDDEGLLDTSSR